MPFAPGDVGNPTGKQVNKPFLVTLNRAMAQDDAKRLRQCAETLLDKAADGEPWAVALLADRLDGKARQSTEITGHEGGPIQITEIIIRSVAARDPQP